MIWCKFLIVYCVWVYGYKSLYFFLFFCMNIMFKYLIFRKKCKEKKIIEKFIIKKFIIKKKLILINLFIEFKFYGVCIFNDLLYYNSWIVYLYVYYRFVMFILVLDKVG